MKKENSLLSLFLTCLKVGLFAFGGGYAIIALLENEFLDKRKWIDEKEFTTVLTVAESTPGPIAVNAATYIGYKLKGFIGSVTATVGVCLPAFILMLLVSVFYDRFMEIALINSAFKGIQVCVIFIIGKMGFKSFMKMKKTAFNITAFVLTFILVIIANAFVIPVSSVMYILICAFSGLIIHLVKTAKARREKI